jgi:hypothetical protein
VNLYSKHLLIVKCSSPPYCPSASLYPCFPALFLAALQRLETSVAERPWWVVEFGQNSPSPWLKKLFSVLFLSLEEPLEEADDGKDKEELSLTAVSWL